MGGREGKSQVRKRKGDGGTLLCTKLVQATADNDLHGRVTPLFPHLDSKAIIHIGVGQVNSVQFSAANLCSSGIDMVARVLSAPKHDHADQRCVPCVCNTCPASVMQVFYTSETRDPNQRYTGSTGASTRAASAIHQGPAAFPKKCAMNIPTPGELPQEQYLDQEDY